MVIFGGAGDLSKRMLIPALFHIYQDGEFPQDSEIIGVGLPEMTSEQYQGFLTETIESSESGSFNQKDWHGFKGRLSYISGDLDDASTYRELMARIEELRGKCGNNVMYYLSVPAGAIEPIVGHLKALDLCRGTFNTKLIVEKPFGWNRASAIKLNELLLDAFDESQIFRIDFYLAMETVQNIIFFRFANAVFEQLWNSEHIDNVQLTVSEDIGIEQRGRFYEQTGIVRDMVQNHLLQLVSLIAMEQPGSFAADSIRDEKVKVVKAIRPWDKDIADSTIVRGQYAEGRIGQAHVAGYRQESDVAPDSHASTYFAARLLIDNQRWNGVPFYIRTGKRMARNLTQVCIQFRRPPNGLFGCKSDDLDPNILYLTLVPEEKINLSFGVKYPHSLNQIYSTDLEFDYFDTFHIRRHPPYERLLVDCMKGDLTLFVRQDGVEAAWKIVDPLIDYWDRTVPPDFPNYAAGSWGPKAAEGLLEREGRKWLVL